MDPFSQLSKKKKMSEKETAVDPFVKLPTEIIQTILSFLSPPDEEARTYILSKTFLKAFSTNPHLRFVDMSFSEVLCSTYAKISDSINRNQEVAKERKRFTVYVDHMLTRYQKQNIPIKRLYLCSRVDDDMIAYNLEQCIRKAKELGVKEFHLRMLFFPTSKSSTTLLQSILELTDQLQILELHWCDLRKDIVQNDGMIKFSSLRILKLSFVRIDKWMLQKLIHSCPLLKELEINYREGPETIQVANLPNLKWLNIESTRSLKELSLVCLDITDEQLHNLISECPILQKLILEDCNKLQKINVTSRSLSFLRIKSCRRLMEVMLEAPRLKKYEYTPPTLVM